MITRPGIRRPAGTGQQSSVHASAPSLVGSDGSNELLPSAITWPRRLPDESRPSAGFLSAPQASRASAWQVSKVLGQHLPDVERASERAEASKQIDVARIH